MQYGIPNAQHAARNTPLLFLSLLMLVSCAGTGPSLGDTNVRPADEMVVIYIPSGQFVMGSDGEEMEEALDLCRAHRDGCREDTFTDEQPAHTVLLDGFWLDRTEVTNGQYRRCVDAGECTEPSCWDPEDQSSEEYPVVCVTWEQASAYCEWVGGRLPTEAEWEYAARGPEGRIFPWGDSFDAARLNYCDANCSFDWADQLADDGYAGPAPVGQYPAGASWCGTLDLAGNVWEWVADEYGPYPSERQTNPTGPPPGHHRVLRGGSFDLDPAFVRSAIRNWGIPDRYSPVTGFRCAMPSP